MNRRLLSRVGLIAVLLFAAIQLYRPDRSNPPFDPAQALETGGRAPADVTAILERSCYDCHSSRTRWPWYSNIAPMSWLIADDVSEARKKMDFSRWTTYPPKLMSRKLTGINDEVMKGDMPLKQYLMLHSDAKLTDSDKMVLGDWATAEADRVLAPPPPPLPEAAAFTSNGPFVHVSMILPGKAAGSGPNDVGDQTTRVLTALDAALKKAESSLAQVVTVNVVLRSADDFKAMNDAYAKFWPEEPPSRTTVVAGLPGTDALVGMSAVAIRTGSRREVMLPAGWKRPDSPYSYAIRVGDTLYLSGLVSRRGLDYSLVKGDMAAQMKVIGENAAAILGAAGMSLRDVVSARVFLTDTGLAESMNTMYRTWFPRDPPARATVRAALTGSDYLVEVTLVAVKAATRQVITTPEADGKAGKPNPNLSSAILVGKRLFVSGMLGSAPQSKGDAAAETADMLARIGRTLKAAGFEWTQVTTASSTSRTCQRRRRSSSSSKPSAAVTCRPWR